MKIDFFRTTMIFVDLRALLFTTEVRTAVALVLGMSLVMMAYRAGYGLKRSHSTAFGAGLGSALYVWRLIRRLREGGQADEFHSNSLRGRTYIVTGGGRGIGLVCVELLCELGASRIVLAIRDSEKRAAQIRAMLGDKCSGSRCEIKFVEFDAASASSVASCLESLLRIDKHFDGILCNAGVYGNSSSALDINWLNQARLVHGLKNNVDRIVTVSSIMHGVGNFKATYLETKKQSRLRVYGTGKLAMLFEARALKEEGYNAVSVHPGYVVTDMTKAFGIFGFPQCLAKSVRSAAMNLVYCLIKEKIQNGAYYDTLRPAPQFHTAQSTEQYHRFKTIRQQLIA